MTVNAKLHRAYNFDAAPEPWRAEIHKHDCTCAWCAAAQPALERDEPALTLIELGWLALYAAIVGTAIAFAIDAHGAWHALATCFGAR